MTTIPTTRPKPIPDSKSVNTIPATVTINGAHCFQPKLYIFLNNVGLASLYPTTNRIAAKTDNGILFNNLGIRITEINNKNPCRIVDNFDLPPDCTLAELLTITCVIGKPPINPEIMFPVPCANNSLLVGVTFLSGSSLSDASTHNKVSKLATRAMVNAVTQTSTLVITVKFGKLNWLKKSEALSGIGTLTIWLSPIDNKLLDFVM